MDGIRSKDYEESIIGFIEVGWLRISENIFPLM